MSYEISCNLVSQFLQVYLYKNILSLQKASFRHSVETSLKISTEVSLAHYIEKKEYSVVIIVALNSFFSLRALSPDHVKFAVLNKIN